MLQITLMTSSSQNACTCLSQNCRYLLKSVWTTHPHDELFKGKEAPLKTPFCLPMSRTAVILWAVIYKGGDEEGTQECQNQGRSAHNPLLKTQKSFFPNINKTSWCFAFKPGQDEKVKSKLCACRVLALVLNEASRSSDPNLWPGQFH